VPDSSYYGRNHYIEYIAGNFPVIISIPHGGNLVPSEIGDRTCGETVTDSYTLNLGLELAQAIKQITGCTPHIVISHLKRTKLDVNREKGVATCGDSIAGISWSEYHEFVDSASATISGLSGKGLLIDLHAHGHSIQRLEIGYLLTAAQLRNENTTIDSSFYAEKSSIRNLASSSLVNLTFSELLRGPTSLGGYLAEEGYRSVPGFDEPFPVEGEPYFSGGYITQRHGSRDSGVIDAIQIECNRDVRFVAAERQKFAASLGTAIIKYLGKHYFPDLENLYLLNLTSEGNVTGREKLIKMYAN
jgi:N-formylglutamate amidohydrolase